MSDVIAGNFKTHITNFICGLLNKYKVYETTLRLAFFLQYFFFNTVCGVSWHILCSISKLFEPIETNRNNWPTFRCQMITCSTRQVLQLYTPFTYLPIYCFLKLIRFRCNHPPCKTIIIVTGKTGFVKDVLLCD